MGTIFVILAVAIIAIFVLGITVFPKIFKWPWRIVAVVLLIVVIFASGSYKQVPIGSVGIRTTFDTNPVTISQGPQWINPLTQKVKIISLKQQDKHFPTQIWGESTDKVQVYMADVIVNYQINPEQAAWIYENVNNYEENLVNPVDVASALKNAAAALPSEEVTKRGAIEPLALAEVQNGLDLKYGENVVIVNKVTINDMNFEDSFNTAIAAKLAAQKEYETAVIQNQQAIEKAEAQNIQSVAAAEAQATVRLTQAQAEAEAIKMKAEAEAEANRLLSESITPEILAEMEMEARQAHGWVTINGSSVVTVAQ